MADKQFGQFACPVHKHLFKDNFYCEECGKTYPLANGIPVLLNEANSVFRISDYTCGATGYGGASEYAGVLDQSMGIRRAYRELMTKISESSTGSRDFSVSQAVDYINNSRENPRILVIGAGEMACSGNVTYTDVAFGKNVCCIADAHDLPFESSVFDGCIVCSVLEHVADPQRCVAEIVRVLKPAGFVFSETPFMQPVHMKEHDFTRFTYLGHRRLFRQFDEIRSGMANGPATSSAQLFRCFLLALVNGSFAKKIVAMAALILCYPFRLLDGVAKKTPQAYDSASGFYFFGTLRDEPISDREILKFYRGG